MMMNCVQYIGQQLEVLVRHTKHSQKPAVAENHLYLSAISVKNAVVAAFAAITNVEMILTVILPHGRTGGAYSSIEEYAEVMGKKAYTALTQAYKEGRWDGTMNGELPAMTPPVVKSTEGGQDEV